MRNNSIVCVLAILCLVSFGCAPILIGAAVGAGAVGGYAVSKDTIQTDLDKPYENIWNSALSVSKNYGNIKYENIAQGYLELEQGPTHVWIRLSRMTRATTRIRVSVRKYHLPNMALAQEIFAKVVQEAR
ncbi:MAG: DUF3568 family protein [Candidatus Omnitrophota bacterium]|nr:DUF3568 family protein [Candidatus Omnitrophota bacterium]MBU1929720.1 DUF3568 family protein [Candidatus Omnitrophota bacterium]MBU2035118.1 DUF3568 family protein [Candidatus Omnitrophota bacterium]